MSEKDDSRKFAGELPEDGVSNAVGKAVKFGTAGMMAATGLYVANQLNQVSDGLYERKMARTELKNPAQDLEAAQKLAQEQKDLEFKALLDKIGQSSTHNTSEQPAPKHDTEKNGKAEFVLPEKGHEKTR